MATKGEVLDILEQNGHDYNVATAIVIERLDTDIEAKQY